MKKFKQYLTESLDKTIKWQWEEKLPNKAAAFIEIDIGLPRKVIFVIAFMKETTGSARKNFHGLADNFWVFTMKVNDHPDLKKVNAKQVVATIYAIVKDVIHSYKPDILIYQEDMFNPWVMNVSKKPVDEFEFTMVNVNINTSVPKLLKRIIDHKMRSLGYVFMSAGVTGMDPYFMVGKQEVVNDIEALKKPLN